MRVLRHVRRERLFATRDKRYYSPLCLLPGLGHAAFASGDLGA